MMTMDTNRNNIKPVFRRIAFMVMVVYRLVATRTLQRIRSRQCTSTNCATNSTCSFFINIIWVLIMKTFLHSPKSRSTFIALSITFVRSLTLFTPPIIFVIGFLVDFSFFTLSIILFAGFAYSCVSIFVACMLIKFSKRFDLLASATSFRYDLLSHFRLLIRRLWLEPYAPPVGVSGSLYYNTNNKESKKNKWM